LRELQAERAERDEECGDRDPAPLVEGVRQQEAEGREEDDVREDITPAELVLQRVVGDQEPERAAERGPVAVIDAIDVEHEVQWPQGEDDRAEEIPGKHQAEGMDHLRASGRWGVAHRDQREEHADRRKEPDDDEGPGDLHVDRPVEHGR
jgi:hypothetical protein